MNKNKIGIILIISLLVILLLTIIVGFVFIFKNLNSQDTTSAIVQEEQQQQEEITDISDIVLFELADPIYTNLMLGLDGGEHVIKLSVNLGIDYSGKKKKESDKLVATLTEKIPIIKDCIINVLRNKTYEELIKVDTQSVLKSEILERLKQEFNTDLIIKVYINDLILQ